MAYGPELFDLDNATLSSNATQVDQTVVVSGELGNTSIIIQALTINTSSEYKYDFTISSYTEGGCYCQRPFNSLSEHGSAEADGNYSYTEVGDLGYGFMLRSNAGASHSYVISNISLKEVIPTTTVTVAWTDSTTQGVTGHKVYRDDVEIADVGMGVETYDDDTAETGTTYKYEVQAYSANNLTDREVVDTNVKSITTAS